MEVEGDPELLAKFEKKLKLLFIFCLKFLKMLDVLEAELPLFFDALDEPALLQASTTGLARIFQ